MRLEYVHGFEFYPLIIVRFLNIFVNFAIKPVSLLIDSFYLRTSHLPVRSFRGLEYISFNFLWCVIFSFFLIFLSLFILQK